MYTCTFIAYGNPDHGENMNQQVAPKFLAQGYTLEQIQQFWKSYRDHYDLGGGNCPEMIVYHNGTAFGKLAYNGKIFDLDGKVVA